MWSRVALGALLGYQAGCGRVAFDEVPAPYVDPALGALGCGASRVIADLPVVPLGLGLVSTAGGAIVAWSAGIAGPTLAGTRLTITGDEVVASDGFSTELPRPVAELGLVGDGEARFLLSSPLAGAAFIPLDSKLTAGAAVALPGAITGHAVAEPIAAGGPLVAAWLDTGASTGIVRFAQLSATGAPTGAAYMKPGLRDVSIRRAAQRHLAVWAASGGGCAVWALDDAFAPVIQDPVVHLPGGACLRAAITRHEASGINLLAWITGGDARAQLGTDTEVVGDEVTIAAGADDLDLATAPGGFLIAVASGDTLLTGHVRLDGAGADGLVKRAHLPGSPIRIVAHAAGALVASIDSTAGAPQLMLTRLCEP